MRMSGLIRKLILNGNSASGIKFAILAQQETELFQRRVGKPGRPVSIPGHPLRVGPAIRVPSAHHVHAIFTV
jgi:hypothetical protein